MYFIKKYRRLKNLDTKEIDSFLGMFFGCKALSNIKALENWNVSNVNNF